MEKKDKCKNNREMHCGQQRGKHWTVWSIKGLLFCYVLDEQTLSIIVIITGLCLGPQLRDSLRHEKHED